MVPAKKSNAEAAGLWQEQDEAQSCGFFFGLGGSCSAAPVELWCWSHLGGFLPCQGQAPAWSPLLVEPPDLSKPHLLPARERICLV